VRDKSIRGYLGRKASRWQGRRALINPPTQPMVSFCFDDVPLSAALEGAAIIEEAGARASFYVCSAYASGESGELAPYADWERLSALAQHGHEIGCHTADHCNNALASRSDLLGQIEANRQALAAHGLPPAMTYAFPFGDVSGAAKSLLAGQFALLRATWPGILRRGGDINAAPAVAIEGEQAVANARRWLAKLSARPGWLIFYTHGVAANLPAYGIRPDDLRTIVTNVTASGIKIVTVAEGAWMLGLHADQPA
jgi:peptidoglycan/xylan/chitin deacetylase (PgdA/CDA1 family)